MMRITVIGPGAMGSIYGGRLSLHNEVLLVGRNQAQADRINAQGLLIDEGGTTNYYRPKALTDTANEPPVELVVLFVKSMASRSVLEAHRGLIGPETYLLTLQNGAGHEELLKEFVSEDRVIIGTTEDNGATLALGHVRRGGEGRTNVGMLVPDSRGFLPRLKAAFDACGFQVLIHEDIRRLVWDKLFNNSSLSALTGVLQVDMGYIAQNEYAWAMARQLIHEAVAVAKAAGLEFDEEAVAEKVRKNSLANPQGCTSIRADLRDGRMTEVDTISGTVVRAAEKYGVPAPSHQFIVRMVHAMEGKNTVQ